LERLKKSGVVPVVKLNDAKNAVPLARAMLAGGIECMEITFRTAAAEEAIAAVSREVPEMYVGAGTVITTQQADAARDAGAKFLVSPGLCESVIRAGKAVGLTIIPGVVTPTEVIAAIDYGFTVLKFFPAENYGGLKTLKALCAPFGQVKFVPTGGINEQNAAEYLKFGKVLAVGGSWMVPEKLIDAGDFDGITRLCANAAEIVKQARG